MSNNNEQEKSKLISELLMSKIEGIESAITNSRSDQTRMFEELKGRSADTEKSLAEIARCNQRHEHALFGVNGDNGISSEVRGMKKGLEVIEKWKIKVMGVALGAGLVAGLAKELLMAWLSK